MAFMLAYPYSTSLVILCTYTSSIQLNGDVQKKECCITSKLSLKAPSLLFVNTPYLPCSVFKNIEFTCHVLLFFKILLPNCNTMDLGFLGSSNKQIVHLCS